MSQETQHLISVRLISEISTEWSTEVLWKTFSVPSSKNRVLLGMKVRIEQRIGANPLSLTCLTRYTVRCLWRRINCTKSSVKSSRWKKTCGLRSIRSSLTVLHGKDTSRHDWSLVCPEIYKPLNCIAQPPLTIHTKEKQTFIISRSGSVEWRVLPHFQILIGRGELIGSSKNLSLSW